MDEKSSWYDEPRVDEINQSKWKWFDHQIREKPQNRFWCFFFLEGGGIHYLLKTHLNIKQTLIINPYSKIGKRRGKKRRVRGNKSNLKNLFSLISSKSSINPEKTKRKSKGTSKFSKEKHNNNYCIGNFVQKSKTWMRQWISRGEGGEFRRLKREVSWEKCRRNKGFGIYFIIFQKGHYTKNKFKKKWRSKLI